MADTEGEVDVNESTILVLLLSFYTLSGCIESTLAVGQPCAVIENEALIGGVHQQPASVSANGLYVSQTRQLTIK